MFATTRMRYAGWSYVAAVALSGIRVPAAAVFIPVSVYALSPSCTVPENATNGTDVSIIIWGTYLTEEGQELETDNLNLLLKVRFIPPKKPKEEKSIPQIILDFIMENTWVMIIIAVGVGFGVVYVIWASRKKRQEDALLDQYKAYVDSQGEQREAGGPY